MDSSQIYKHYRHNFIVNVLDGGFFGCGLGFASFMTVIPLFFSTMTNSAILIGMIGAIHSVGWQFPQLFTAGRVSRLRRYKPMAMLMTIHERVPFLGLAVIAFAVPMLGVKTALMLSFLMLVWQGLGGGLTANPWQSMIGKIIPGERRGTFFGIQSAAANLFATGSAVIAGILLDRYKGGTGFMLCFLLASICMVFSYVCMGQTREPDSAPTENSAPVESWRLQAAETTGNVKRILKNDPNFRWFLVVRMLSQASVMAFAFYTVYAVRRHGMSEVTAGVMMSVFNFGQIIANPLMGWIGDRSNHPMVMKFGLLAAALSAGIAWLAPSQGWFTLVFILAGIANVGLWTIAMAMTLQFGSEADRPMYIGMANTLIAPATIIMPLIGGWLADTAGYSTTFIVSAVSALLTLAVLQFMLRDPRLQEPRYEIEA